MRTIAPKPLRAATASDLPPRTVILAEILSDFPVWPDALLARFTAVPPDRRDGRQRTPPPRYSANDLVARANGLSLTASPTAVVLRPVTNLLDGGPAAARGAVARLAEGLHVDPRAFAVQVEYAPDFGRSPALLRLGAARAPELFGLAPFIVPRRANPPRKGALVEVEKREAGYFYRHPMGHLAGPYGSAAKARAEGALALAAALHPAASRAELTGLAAALLEEDPARPYVRQFSDGWRVWDPARRLFVGAAPGVAFAARGAAEARRRDLAGEADDDGAMFRRAPAPPPASAVGDLFAPRATHGGGGGGAVQLGLFGARGNPRRRSVHGLRRANPAPGLGPLRGADGEAVSYRDLSDGRVRVRASVVGAGTSENDMDHAAALRHREKLLHFGYRADLARHRRSVPRRAPKRTCHAGR